MKKPFDILYDAMAKSIAYDKHGRYSKPGSIILGLPEEDRKILSKLKSDDIKDKIFLVKND